MRLLFFSCLFFLITNNLFAQSTTNDSLRWQIKNQNAIQWNVKTDTRLPHSDNIEMAGQRVAGIVTYSIDEERNLSLSRKVIFPQFHPLIKDSDPSWYVYRSYAQTDISDDEMPRLFSNGKQVSFGQVERVELDGTLKFFHAPAPSGLQITRTLFPATTDASFYERWAIKNTTMDTIIVQVGEVGLSQEGLTKDITFAITTLNWAIEDRVIAPDSSTEVDILTTCHHRSELEPKILRNEVQQVLTNRTKLVEQWTANLILETPDPVLNTMFSLAKIRASENIFQSKLGLIHSPGGGRYYVGIWANDQAEYVSPFFPYLGYEIGNESALNCYRAFAKEINPEYTKLPYAFEVEGLRPPAPLDRGDAAMIAYGASQFVLAYGNQKVAQELWELIEWCLEYNHRQLNAAGVVQSESDEMEGRIETGDANLSTSALYYGALDLAVNLAADLGQPKSKIKQYEQRKNALHKAIENYFGAKVEGLDTYRYYDGHTNLRHWICLPLVVGIFDRSDATTEALFDRLWSETGGVHVEKNSDNPEVSEIFWDRGTLYALRGTFLAGATERSLAKLQQYSQERLLGARVPYAVEAYPEGNMAHLSAESGLYCRIFTEGIFGIVPTGLRRFKMTPRLPQNWDRMALRQVKAFGGNFDVEVVRQNGLLRVLLKAAKSEEIIMEKEIQQGETVEFRLKLK